jgi:hypothetical protein
MPLYTSMELVMKDRAEHAREASRLTALAATVTTPAMREQVLAMAREHARLAARAQNVAERDGSEFFVGD